jgi:cytochrome b6-f complex iron-sulfur subunit
MDDDSPLCPLTRRHAIAVMVARGTVLVAALAGAGETQAAGGWVPVGKVAAFPVGAPRKVRLPDGRAVFILRPTRGAWTALTAACTHKGVEIAWAARQKRFVCPAHGASFTAEGRVVDGPAKAPLTPLPLRLAGGQLQVDTGKAPAAPRRRRGDDDEGDEHEGRKRRDDD